MNRVIEREHPGAKAFGHVFGARDDALCRNARQYLIRGLAKKLQPAIKMFRTQGQLCVDRVSFPVVRT